MKDMPRTKTFGLSLSSTKNYWINFQLTNKNIFFNFVFIFTNVYYEEEILSTTKKINRIFTNTFTTLFKISITKSSNLVEHLFFEECIEFDENNSIKILPKFEECGGFLDGDLDALIWSLFYLDCYSGVQSILERYVIENENLDIQSRIKRIKTAKLASLSLFFASEEKTDVRFRFSCELFGKVQDLMENIRNSEVRSKFIQ